MQRRVATIVAAAWLAAAPIAAQCATAFSTDGEATVYRAGDFHAGFSLAYDAFARAEPRNTAWSTLSITLLGGAPPADAMTIGLIPDAGGAHVFTSSVRSGVQSFHDTGIVCARTCRLGLRGDHGAIVALVNGKSVRSWPRFSYALPHATVQLNAEVSAAGDRIDAHLELHEETAAGVALAHVRCAFTTQGVIPASTASGLRFHGSFVRGAPATYIDLRNGRRLERCPR